MLVAKSEVATLSDDQATNECIEQQMVVITDLCTQLGKKGLVVNQKELTQAVATFVTTKLAADQQSLTDGRQSIATVLDKHVDEFMKEFGLPKTQKKQFKAVLAQVFGTHVPVRHKKSGLAIRGQRWSLLFIIGLVIVVLVCLVNPVSAYCSYSTHPGNDPCHSATYAPPSTYQPTPAPTPTYYPSQPSPGPFGMSGQAYAAGYTNQQQLMNHMNHGGAEQRIPW